MRLTPKTLEEFAALRDRLGATFKALSGTCSKLDDVRRRNEFERSHDALYRERFRIVVIGEMKQGKSSLINALVRDDVLPVDYAFACTAIPIRLRFGTKPYALLYGEAPEPLLELDPLQERERLQQALSVPKKEGAQGSAAKTNPKFSRAVLRWPSQLLQQGAEFVDTPGLDEDTERSEAAWNEVADADAVTCVLTCRQLGRKSDAGNLQRIVKGLDPRLTFVVWNWKDDFGDDLGGVDRVRAGAERICQEVGIPRDHVFLVSARDARTAHSANDPALLEDSGVPAFEQCLGSFLVSENRCAAKLLGHVAIAERSIPEVLRLVEERRNRLTQRMAEGNGCLVRCRACVDRTARIEASIQRDIKRANENLEVRLRSSLRGLADDLSSELDDVVTSVPMTWTEALFSKQECVSRIAAAVKEWMQGRAAEWEEDELSIVVGQYRGEVQDRTRESIAELEQLVNEAQTIANEMIGADASTALMLDQVSRQRTTDELAGRLWRMGTEIEGDDAWVVVGVGAIVGGVAGLWATAVFLWPLLPFALVTTVCGAIFGGIGAAERLKTQVAKELRKALQERATNASAQAVEQVVADCDEVVATVRELVELQKGTIASLFEAVSEEYTRLDEDVEAQLARVDIMREELKGYERELHDIRQAVDPLHAIPGQISEVKTAIATGFRRIDEKMEGHAATGYYSQLSPDLQLRVDAICGHFEKQGRWASDMKEELARWWVQYEPGKGMGEKEEFAYRAVAAVAVITRHVALPEPAEVRKWYMDKGLRDDLVWAWVMSGGNPDEEYFGADQPGTFGNSGQRFCRAYRRAYRRAVKAGVVVERKPTGEAVFDEHVD